MMNQKIPREIVTKFAPIGKLRASINLGNPVLAKFDQQSGSAVGISVDIARALAEHLDVPLDLIVVDKANLSVEAIVAQTADIGFFAIDPARADKITFTRPYVLIEGCYLVREDSPLTSASQIDVTGQKIATSEGSAYDLFLSRSLKNATIVRSKLPTGVVPLFLDQSLDAAAGIRQQLQSEADQVGGLRLLPEPFMVIRQAMGIAKDRGPEVAAVLDNFVGDSISAGLIHRSIAANKVEGVSVA